MHRTRPARDPRTPAASRRAEDVQEMVRELTRRALHPNEGETGGADGRREEVVFEMEVDGTRCLLLRPASREASDAVALSPREREIARLISLGNPNKTIAAILDISSWTVSTYLRRIFAKLGVSSRAAMVAKLMAMPSAPASRDAGDRGPQGPSAKSNT